MIQNLNIAFVKMVSGIINQALPVGHAEALAGRAANQHVNVVKPNQLPDIRNNMPDIPEDNMLSRRFGVIMRIGVNAAWLNVVGKACEESLLGKAQGQTASAAEQIDHFRCAGIPGALRKRNIGIAVFPQRTVYTILADRMALGSECADGGAKFVVPDSGIGNGCSPGHEIGILRLASQLRKEQCGITGFPTID